MDFNIYTVGAGIFLEKIFNAIGLVLGNGASIAVLIVALVVGVAVYSMANNGTFKGVCGSVVIPMILIVFCLVGTATVRIHDKSQNSGGGLPAVRIVENVPFGVAFFASATSSIGHKISEALEEAFGGDFPSRYTSGESVKGSGQLWQDFLFGFLQLVLLLLFAPGAFRICRAPKRGAQTKRNF